MSAAYALAIHTSSPDLGLAIQCLDPEHDASSTVRSHIFPLGRALSSQLHLHLQDFIQPQTWQDFAFIAVAIGPGGFTGTRIGVVTARTLAQQLEIPLFGVSSLAAIAHAQPEIPSGLVAVEMPAQRGELFGSVYQIHQPSPETGSLTAVLCDRTFTPDAWRDDLATLTQPYTLIPAPANQGQFASSILDLALQQWWSGQRPHWSSVVPFYGQHPVTLNSSP